MAQRKVRVKKALESNAASKFNYSKNKEIYWILGAMIVCILVILLIPLISKASNTFRYKGLTFTKERFGEIPVFHYYYSFSNNGENYQYNLFLRNDPRESKVNVSGEIIYPPATGTVYVSINGEDMAKCKDSLREIYSLADFMQGNLYKVKSGYPNKNFSEQNNLTYIDCSTNPNDMVILIKEGNETKIERNNKCYTVSVANCQLLDAIEKFEVQSVIDARNRARSN